MSHSDLGTIKSLVVIGALTAGMLAESFWPYFLSPRHSWRAATGNLLWGVLNAIAGALVIAVSLRFLLDLSEQQGWGLLHQASLPPLAQTGLALLLIDGWQYLWHRLNHQWSWLWKFHRVHHADAAMAATTAFRFHTVEVLLSGVARLAIGPLLGWRVGDLLWYEILVTPIIVLHHANIRLPSTFERWLAWLVVTPRLHRVHHSPLKHETNSNYASGLSCWDRLGRSLQPPRPSQTETGLDLQPADADRWWPMALWPWRK